MYFRRQRSFGLLVYIKAMVCLAMILFVSHSALAQNYGLSFYSHNELKDDRTELNLTPDKSFKFNRDFALSFDLKFHSNYGDRFGYIVRLVKNETYNIDIVYNRNNEDGLWYFYLISGQHTAEMLELIGISAEEQERLSSEGIV